MLELIRAFIKKNLRVRDPRDTLDQAICQFGSKALFYKPVDVDVNDHHTRMQVLMKYYDFIPGAEGATLNPLTQYKKNQIYLRTFPKSWCNRWFENNNFTNNNQWDQISEFMM